MCTATAPASVREALTMLESAAGFLAHMDAAELPAELLAEGLRALERTDAAGAAVRGRFLQAFDAQDGPVADGQRAVRAWLVHSLRVTKGQAAEHQAVERLARNHPVLLAGLARAGWSPSRSRCSWPGDGGAWLEGEAARRVACDAMIVPVVTGDLDPGAVEELITLCVRYHALRTEPSAPSTGPAGPGTTAPDTQAPAANGDTSGPGTPDSAAVPAGLVGRAARQAGQAAAAAEALADLEHQIIAKVLQVLSGPGGVASFLRRNLLGKGLGGPFLPLDVGQTDDIPVHLRRLVALRDQHCQHPGGCFL